MNREQKTVVVNELQEKIARASVAFVATNQGLSVAEVTGLRRKLRAADGEYKVAKLTLIRRALGSSQAVGLEKLLRGPRGLVFGYSDPISVARILVDFADQNKNLAIDGGAIGGQLMGSEEVRTLATMPNVTELRARVARQVTTPARWLVSMIVGPAARIAGALAALSGRSEKTGAGT